MILREVFVWQWVRMGKLVGLDASLEALKRKNGILNQDFLHLGCQQS